MDIGRHDPVAHKLWNILAFPFAFPHDFPQNEGFRGKQCVLDLNIVCEQRQLQRFAIVRGE